MISYELAKQLKDAGFDQTRGVGKSWAIYETNGVASTPPELLEAPNRFKYQEIYYCPTLSELIMACGEGFMRLTRIADSGQWYIEGWSSPIIKLYADTPEEAVANLYIALNK